MFTNSTDAKSAVLEENEYLSHGLRGRWTVKQLHLSQGLPGTYIRRGQQFCGMSTLD
jgi:hypothetical protein